ncbi:uncharacterized protein LOC120009718 [Tripterygium wilfordii]|uniref:uncharacterized protein LOC120009718 n=1 Tax=Tripterygium wilfordii TaxID=458696 RepID=UPI0018F7E9C8|nr:uncharacterized protein LOC120009718 [Tripterygium wilfordii]
MPLVNPSASSRLGFDGIGDSSNNISMPTTPTSGTPNTASKNSQPPQVLPERHIERPLGQKSTKDKRSRSVGTSSQASDAASERLHSTICAWKQKSKSRLESMKQINEEQQFHAIKFAKLEEIQKCIQITKDLVNTEKDLLSLMPELPTDEVAAKVIARMRQLDELDKEHQCIRAMEFSPRASTRICDEMQENNINPCNLESRFDDVESMGDRT